MLGFLANAVRQEKEIKSVKIRKEEAKLSLFSDDITAFLANLTL